jgi:hypothetical protein
MLQLLRYRIFKQSSLKKGKRKENEWKGKDKRWPENREKKMKGM